MDPSFMCDLLAQAAEAGVAKMMKLIDGGMRVTMTLAGVKTISGIGRTMPVGGDER